MLPSAATKLTVPLLRELEDLLDTVERCAPPAAQVKAARLRKELLARVPRRELTEPLKGQIPLWTSGGGGELCPWRGRLPPEAIISCPHFSGPAIPLVTCLVRQGATWPGGNRWKDGSVRAKKAGIHPYCSSGACMDGKLYAASVVATWMPPKFKFYRDDTPAQRRARKEYIVSHPDGGVPTMDDPIGSRQERPDQPVGITAGVPVRDHVLERPD